MWHPNIYEVGCLGQRGVFWTGRWAHVRPSRRYWMKMPAFVWHWSTALETQCLWRLVPGTGNAANELTTAGLLSWSCFQVSQAFQA